MSAGDPHIAMLSPIAGVTPVVAIERGSMGDIVHDGETGFLVREDG